MEQYKKHHKHTVPDSRYPIQSVFGDPSTSAYAGHLVDTMLGGAIEVDEQGRTNIIFAAGRQTGFRYEFGQLIQPSDAVKVVQSSNSGLVHAFPENSTSFNAGVCEKCGKLWLRHQLRVRLQHRRVGDRFSQLPTCASLQVPE